MAVDDYKCFHIDGVVPAVVIVEEDFLKINKDKVARKITYPACWSDTERMKVLFAPFRVREVNPENYDSKMKFWQDMIEQYCKEMGTVIFSKIAVQTAFARGSSIAYGLDTVIDELLRSKKIRLRTEYEYDPQNGWTSWAMNGLVWRPIAWSIFKMKSMIGYGDQKSASGHIEYVHLSVVDTFCKELLSKVLNQNVGKLMHYTELKKLIDAAGIELNNESLQLCLRTLHCRRQLVLEYKRDSKTCEIHLVKIPAPNDKSSNSITETDHAVHNLQITQVDLTKQMEDLEAQITEVTNKARQYAQENKRQMAKSYLRKKHLLEKNYEKRSLALHNIEELLNSVNEARSHGEILDAYKIGSRALQNVLSTSGLRYDSVDEVISEVRESLDSQREVEDAMNNASFVDTNFTSKENDELERELHDLVEKDSTKPALEKQTKTSPTSAPSLEVTISDSELLAMLDKLEVEDNSPKEKSQLSS